MDIFRDVRTTSDYSDVILISCDLEVFPTHKLVLGASSVFFRKIFDKTKSSQPEIFLRGMGSREVKSLLDFIYFGEANVNQEDLDSFLYCAQELELKGMGEKE